MHAGRRTLLRASAALAAWPLAAWGAPGERPRIVASFSILADIARALAPADAEVSALVGPDSDAHVFEPTPAHGRMLAQADLVLVNGLGFEGWIDRLIGVSGFRGPVVVASRGVPPRQADGATDPHAWQDLALGRQYVQTLSAALAERWPARRDELALRRATYLARLARTEQRVREALGAIPRAQRRVISSHDAFGYFGAAYGVDFLAPQGWNTHSEPSAAAVARLIRQIRQQGVRALFVENISDPRLIERIAHEAGVHVGGALYSDALSAPGGPADSYLKLFEHNAVTIADALAPPR